LFTFHLLGNTKYFHALWICFFREEHLMRNHFVSHSCTPLYTYLSQLAGDGSHLNTVAKMWPYPNKIPTRLIHHTNYRFIRRCISTMWSVATGSSCIE
jgi:hypothetical protein